MQNALKFHVGGAWVSPLGGEQVEVFNPADGSPVGVAALGSESDADRAVAAARASFPDWSCSPIAVRIELLKRMRAAFAAAAPKVAAHLVREVGMTAMTAKGQEMMCLSHFDTVLDLLPRYEFSTRVDAQVELVREPIGVVAAITSWNAPVSQMLCKLVPAIAAGCTVVVKPSEQAPLCGILLAEALDGAGIPPGVFNLINGRGADCGRRLAGHPDVDMISFTGSVTGGGAVAAAAAPTIKRVHQELGGKSANILLPDADFARVVPASVMACMMNAGQVCAAPTRLIVPEDRFDEVAALAVAAADAIVVGSPDTLGTGMGPLVSATQFTRVQSMIAVAIVEGVPLLTGGPGKPPGLAQGHFVRPTIFGPVAPDAAIAQEEVFGPVLAILTYRDEADAIRIANNSRYGLAACVQSADAGAARRVAGRLRAGYVTINFPGWTAAAPFGGHRQSGNGLQYGVWGFEEFLETKAIVT